MPCTEHTANLNTSERYTVVETGAVVGRFRVDSDEREHGDSNYNHVDVVVLA